MMSRATSSVRTNMGILTTLFMALILSASSAPDSPVADAAMEGDFDAVRALITRGADVNASQGDGMTALHWAAESGNVAMIETLLFAGAFTDVATRNGSYTALHLGARAGQATAVGAPPGRRESGRADCHWSDAAPLRSCLRSSGQRDCARRAWCRCRCR